MFCFRTPGCPEQKHPGVWGGYTRMLKGARWGCLRSFLLVFGSLLACFEEKHHKGTKTLRCECI